MGEAVDGVVGALDGLDASAGLDALDGEALMAVVLSLETARRRLDAVNAAVFGALDRCGATEAVAGLGVKRWKAHRTKGADAAVGRELRVARTLERFTLLAAGLAGGEVSADHVLAVAAVCNPRIADGLVEHEARIVRMAKLHEFRRFRVFLVHLAAMLDPDGAEPDCGDRDIATMGRDLEGHLHVRLELSGHNAIEAERIITEEVDRQRRQAVAEHLEAGLGVPEAAVLRARAVMELLRRGAKANPHSPTPVVEAILPVVVDRNGAPVAVRSSDAADLDDVTAAVLLCDAWLTPVITDTTGAPLRLARRARLFSAGQRAAMTVRDGGCVFPGCDQPPARCDAHHRHPWGGGGLTDTDKGCLLCRRHHGLVHAADPWVVSRVPSADLPAGLATQHRLRAETAGLDPAVEVLVWRSPTGRVLLAQNATDHNGAPPPRKPAA